MNKVDLESLFKSCSQFGGSKPSEILIPRKTAIELQKEMGAMAFREWLCDSTDARGRFYA